MAETKIPARRIGADLTDANIGAGANIASSKLADGGNFTKKDGSVAFTGNQSMGNNKITNLATPTPGSNDAARIIDVENKIAELNSAYKYRTVRAKSTANVDISNPGTAVFDGVTLTSGDVLLGSILLNNQSTASQNGLYLFNGSGSAMTRLSNANAWDEFPGSLVFVNEGTTNGNTRWQNTNDDGGTLGSTSITYVQDVSNGVTASNFVFNETPSGSINGSNVTFTLASTPVSGTVRLRENGIWLRGGSGNDYTISGGTITMTTAPVSGDWLEVDYMK